ncbi:MAG TPA: AAA family ATPase, partial [Chloroflexota bacterium]|nr:AAA family ATPase [Chloroflexota bacterium]
MYARPILCPSLSGRGEEMALVEQAVDAAATGRGSSLLLLGEAGIGKSRLAREASTRAEDRRMRVLWGRCVEGGQTAPYRPLAEALLAALRDDPPPDVPELRPFRPILGQLIPDWRSEVAADRSVVLLGEAILRLLRVLCGEHGGLVVLEDLHWADPETLAAVDYLGANLGREPLLLLGTLRTGEPSPALSLVTSFRSRRIGQVLELARLPESAIQQMACACLGVAELPDPVKAGLASSADGLPLLVEDLLAEWVAAGQLSAEGASWRVEGDLAAVVPVTFAETVQRRLAELGPEAADILRLAALLGRRFDWRLLSEAARVGQDDLLDVLRRAVQLQLIRVEPGARETGFAFRHALTQDAVLAELLPQQRARLAGSLLEHVEQAHPDMADEWCDLAARLAVEAGQRTKAAALLLESGRRAFSNGALTTAEATLARAAELCGRGSLLATDVQEALIDTLALAGKHQQVGEAGTALLTDLRQLGSRPERLAQAHLKMARARVAASDWAAAGEHLQQARQLAAIGDAVLLPCLDAVAAHVAVGRGRLEEARELARAARENAEAAGLWEVACEALEVLGRVARESDLREAEAAFEAARRIAEAHHLVVWRVRAVHELGTIDLFTPGGGTDRLMEARELAEQCGALGLAAMVDVQLAAAHVALGDFEAVRAFAARSGATAERLGLNVTHAIALLFTAEAHSRLGPDRPAMEATLAQALRAAGDDERLRSEVQGAAWGDSRAIASLVEEDRARALEETRKAEAFYRAAAGSAPSPSRGLWALLETLAGDHDLVACREIEASPAMVQPMNQALTRYARAVVAGRQGRTDAANEAVAAGDAAVARSCPWGLHLGRRLVADEAIQHGWGEPAIWLAEAALFFDGHGQPRIASACRSLLRKAGGQAIRSSRSHPNVP